MRKDNKFLEAATAGDAQVLVSGDHHLLSLKTFRGIRILSINQFLEGLV
jgi:predicted nucleic acid-binding protein